MFVINLRSRIPSSILQNLKDNLALGNAAAVYDYLKSQGYPYAGLAQGVNLDNTVSGTTAIEFLGLSGEKAGRPISEAELASIKAGLVDAYLDVLLKRAKDSPDGLTTRDLNSDEAWEIHNKVFKSHELDPDVWTLNTPFSVLNAAGRESLWQKILESDGSVLGDAKAALDLVMAMTQANIDAIKAGDAATVEQIGNWAARIESPSTIAPAIGTALNLLINTAKYGLALLHNSNLADNLLQLADFLKDPLNITGFFRKLVLTLGMVDPLILDIDGDGIQTTNPDTSTAYFDFDNSGSRTHTGWISAGDGFLVLDRNHNGTIDSGAELFSNFTPLANGALAANGFDALRDFDANKDGIIDRNTRSGRRYESGAMQTATALRNPASC
ncbi:hypothetical protein PQR75_07620 [Paraburkholderia fungorum]|uniref:hypothetical protein n=1 Tax=Paraburkholderia fungorum TaxID=134537 RepID=UPI0038BB07CA